jgi:hypothetical protein
MTKQSKILLDAVKKAITEALVDAGYGDSIGEMIFNENDLSDPYLILDASYWIGYHICYSHQNETLIGTNLDLNEKAGELAKSAALQVLFNEMHQLSDDMQEEIQTLNE